MGFFTTFRQLFFKNEAWWYRDPSYQRTSNSDARASSSTDDSSREALLEKNLHREKSENSFWRRNFRLIVFHTLLFILYSAGLYVATMHRSKDWHDLRTQGPKDWRDLRSQGLPYSPAIEALEYSEQQFYLEDIVQEVGSFSGKPSAKLDKAWHDLLDPENVKLEPEILKHFGREELAVALPEGGGYIGTLNVYHEIHCLKRLHQYMYQEYYWPDLDAEQLELNRIHNEHCIDYLRQAAMCHGDVGLMTFEWSMQSSVPVANATTHQCANWEKIEDWVRSRTVDMLKPGYLYHPTLGLAYPDSMGKLGVVGEPDDHSGNSDGLDGVGGY